MLTPTVTELARLSAHRYDPAPRVPPGAPRTGASGGLLAQATTRRAVGSAPLLHAAPAR
jgi:hypothetical protein